MKRLVAGVVVLAALLVTAFAAYSEHFDTQKARVHLFNVYRAAAQMRVADGRMPLQVSEELRHQEDMGGRILYVALLDEMGQ